MSRAEPAFEVHAQNLREDGLAWTDLVHSPRWVVWRTLVRRGKPTKVPFQPFPPGDEARANDPSTWGTYDTAAAFASTVQGDGVGIELGAMDDAWCIGGIDLDTCRNPETGVIDPWAVSIIRRFKTYAEVSPSGTGVKVYFRYSASYLEPLRAVMGGAQTGKQFKREGAGEHPPGIEFYLTNRYFAFTGLHVPGTPEVVHKAFLEDLMHLVKVVGPAFAGPSDVETEQPTLDSVEIRTTPKLELVPKTPLWERIERSALFRPQLRNLLNLDFSSMTDHSRSAKAMAMGGALARAGYSFEDVAQALRTWSQTEEWAREKGDYQNAREIQRIWDKAREQPNESGHLPGAENKEQAARPGRPRILSIAELEALPPPVWLVEGLVPERGLAMPYGPPKKGKTFIALSLALHIAAGLNWMGRRVQQGGVVYIAGEGVGGLGLRVKAMRAHYGISDQVPFWVVPRAVNFSDPAAVEGMVKLVRDTVLDEPIVLVVVDTLARAAPGVEENSSKEMGVVIASCDAVRDALECTVMPIHHAGKDEAKGLRGSSAIHGAVDASFHITGTGKSVTLTPVDQKEADPGPPMVFEMLEVMVGIGRNSLVPVLVEANQGQDQARQDTNLSPQEALAIRALNLALERCGTWGQFSNVPASIPVVKDTEWREAYRNLRAGDDWETSRKAFQRVSRSLITRRIVGCHVPYVWKVRDDGPMQQTHERDTGHYE